MDISNPMFQGMIQEEEDKDRCPKCNAELKYDKNTKELKCTNRNCNFKIKVRIRK